MLNFFILEIFSDYRAKANKYSNFVVPNIKEKNNLEKFTRNTVNLDCLPFYYYYKNNLNIQIISNYMIIIIIFGFSR